MSLLGCTNVFICGKRKRKWALARYNTETGAEVSSVQLALRPFGIARVELDSVPCVALSYP